MRLMIFSCTAPSASSRVFYFHKKNSKASLRNLLVYVLPAAPTTSDKFPIAVAGELDENAGLCVDVLAFAPLL